MTNSHGHTATQLSFFDSPRRAGSLHRREAVQEALVRALAQSPLSRDGVAEELSRVTGCYVSAATINNWTSNKPGHRFPLEYLAGMIEVTGDDGDLARAALSGLPLAVVGVEESRLLELGRLYVEEKARAKRKRALMEELGV